MLRLSLLLIMVTSLLADEDCNRVCFSVYLPVCGSDGNTYSNECLMSIASCIKRQTITKVSEGECNDPEANCKKVCPKMFQPVCGSDGNTYSSKCELSVMSCKKNWTITKLYDGECRLQELNCNMACPQVIDPICGSDGQTYNNKCELLIAACLKQQAIIKVYDGGCNNEGKCKNIPCNRINAPVCGSDGNIYSNECLLRTASCKQKKAITLIRNTNDKSCSCLFECTKEYNPVCGSNRITYSSECVMRRYSCLTKKAIIAIRKGICKLPRKTNEDIFLSSETEIF
nr:ovoinhibitor isoform X2 [Hydra vulgaris]